MSDTRMVPLGLILNILGERNVGCVELFVLR